MPDYIGTCHPEYVHAAIAELRRLDPALYGIEQLAAGVFTYTTDQDRGRWVTLLKSNEPIFLRHQHPVEGRVDLTGEVAVDLKAIAGAAAMMTAAPATASGSPPAVQARRLGAVPAGFARPTRFALTEAVKGPALPPGQIISISLVSTAAYLGISDAAENLSPWPGGERRFPQGALVSRAAGKLMEAWELFGLAAPAGGRALDLGAAPGGWTQVLLEQGLHVTAVDTAPLAAAVANHPRLTFVKANANNFTASPAQFDIITSDMNWNPLATARLVADLTAAMKSSGWAVLTVKLLGKTSPFRRLHQVTDILNRGGWQVVRSRQLFHNRAEVTLLCTIGPSDPYAGPYAGGLY